jgi:Ca2+/Na+ antiporter
LNWKNYIRGLLVSTLIFGGILVFLNVFTSPKDGMVTVAIFMGSVFFFLMGVIAIADFFRSRWWNHNEVVFENIKTSLRHGILFSGFLTSLLMLSAFRVLNWLDAAVLLVCFVLLEIYFRTKAG